VLILRSALTTSVDAVLFPGGLALVTPSYRTCVAACMLALGCRCIVACWLCFSDMLCLAVVSVLCGWFLFLLFLCVVCVSFLLYISN
jgi:hypothetical protein